MDDTNIVGDSDEALSTRCGEQSVVVCFGMALARAADQTGVAGIQL